MSTAATLRTELRDLYLSETARIQQDFANTGSGSAAIAARTALVEQVLLRLWSEVICSGRSDPKNFALVALGGFGQRALFPHSDVDILFLHGDRSTEDALRDPIRNFSQELWDLRMKLGPTTRTLAECDHFDSQNVEFTISLLDCRYLAGDRELFERLHDKILPKFFVREGNYIIQQLAEVTRSRHAKYGNTVFHLEPNIKEAPGGLRDYHATLWMRQLAGDRRDPRISPLNENELTRNAVEFLSGIRCFLHYSNGRNDNTLTYELQADAAEKSLGIDDNLRRNAAEWMRLYFRHARTLNRQLLRYMEQRPATTLSLRQRLMNAMPGGKIEAGSGRAFAVRDGLLELTNEQAFSDRQTIYALLAESSRLGIPLSRDAERGIAYIMLHPELQHKNTRITWPALSEILAGAFPSLALRPMHRLGLLTEALPEFRTIDSLVVRDFYHRYTVDEHSLRAIEHLQELAAPPDQRGAHFAPLWRTVDRRDLLILSLLLHDVGKGMPVESHVAGSLQALETAADRLKLSPEEKSEVHFLIEHHLDMSATVQRRDIFDPSTVSGFAAVAGSQERLQRLCLLTYADIHAVNPEALTPWKSEMLWQLFVATSNHFSRTVDRDRLHVSDEALLLDQVSRQSETASKEAVERFLEGFPRRYLAVHSPEEVALHFALYQKLGAQPVQTELKERHHAFELTLLSADRPALFAAISGVLAAWGMNIVKADAFANYAGVVLDTFHFVDMHHTLELNPGERARFQQSIADVVNGKQPLEPLLKGRLAAAVAKPPKVSLRTSIQFDDDSSDHSTLMEVVTQDRPGLLYEVGSALARQGCNIDVALIDTEGQKAIDVFYLTAQGAKLTLQKKELLREVLEATLG